MAQQESKVLGSYRVIGPEGQLLGSFSYGPTLGHDSIAHKAADAKAAKLSTKRARCQVVHRHHWEARA